MEHSTFFAEVSPSVKALEAQVERLRLSTERIRLSTERMRRTTEEMLEQSERIRLLSEARMAKRARDNARPKALPGNLIKTDCKNCGNLIFTDICLVGSWSHVSGNEFCDSSNQLKETE